MKKLFSFLAVLLVLALAIIPVFAQSYTKSPSIRQGGAKLAYGVKAHPYQVEVIGSILGGGIDSLIANIDGKTLRFVAPFTCLLDSAWVVTGATTDTVDTTSATAWKILFLSGAASVDTGFTFTTGAGAKELRTDSVRYFTAHSTTSKRHLTAGEVYKIKIDTIGAPTVIPRTLTVGWTLIPPDK